MTTTIWHNPRCSKSRQTLALLEERGISPIVRLYLDDAPSTSEVAEVLQQPVSYTHLTLPTIYSV